MPRIPTVKDNSQAPASIKISGWTEPVPVMDVPGVPKPKPTVRTGNLALLAHPGQGLFDTDSMDPELEQEVRRAIQTMSNPAPMEAAVTPTPLQTRLAVQHGLNPRNRLMSTPDTDESHPSSKSMAEASVTEVNPSQETTTGRTTQTTRSTTLPYRGLKAANNIAAEVKSLLSSEAFVSDTATRMINTGLGINLAGLSPQQLDKLYSRLNQLFDHETLLVNMISYYIGLNRGYHGVKIAELIIRTFAVVIFFFEAMEAAGHSIYFQDDSVVEGIESSVEDDSEDDEDSETEELLRQFDDELTKTTPTAKPVKPAKPKRATRTRK